MAEQSVSVSPVRAAELADDTRWMAAITSHARCDVERESRACLRSIATALPEGEAAAMVAGLRRMSRSPIAEEGAWEWCHDVCIGMNNAADLLEAQSLALAQQKAEVARLTANRDKLQQTFDIRCTADRRASKRWQAETGKDLTWPDHADLCVWLLSKLVAAEASEARLRKGNNALGKWMAAALDDPLVCWEMKADIKTWFDSQEGLTPTASGAAPADGEED